MMKVLVKILQGKQCTVDISPTETVLELKNKVRELLGVEVPQQKLLLTGKALADENPLSFYPGIKDGSKLNLVVKKSSQGPSDEKTLTKSGTLLLRDSITKILKHYYSDTETASIVNELIAILRYKVNNMSYDDLERFATAFIQDQESNG